MSWGVECFKLADEFFALQRTRTPGKKNGAVESEPPSELLWPEESAR
jgi:hypothetical protein